MVLVKIIKASNDSYWYKNKIGDVVGIDLVSRYFNARSTFAKVIWPISIMEGGQ